MNFLSRVFVCLMAAVAGIGCSTPGGGIGGSTRDELGHRAGPRGFRTVVIDAGHGGRDSGAISRATGQMEKDLALDTARRLRSELDGQFRVVMLRDDDRFIDLDDRAAMASRHGDGILISVHYNSGPASKTGPETFFWRVDSHGLAARAQQAMRQVAGSSNSRGLVRRRLRLTRNPEIPCLLVELGYLSNSSEARQCSSSGYRAQMARALANAIRTQAAVGDAGTGPLPRPINAPRSRASDAPE